MRTCLQTVAETPAYLAAATSAKQIVDNYRRSE